MAPEGRTRTTAQAQAEGLRVFVAGIPWKLEEDTLRRDFEECGVVEDIFVLKDEQGYSKGRAFITFRDTAAVEAALKFDNTPYGGRTIFVKVAEEKKKGAAAGKEGSAQDKDGSRPKAKGKVKAAEGESGAPRGHPTEKPEGCVSLCLKNIGQSTQADVRTFLKGCTVQSVRIVTDKYTGAARGIAFVDFPNTDEVDKAMAFNGEELAGDAVEMHYEAPRSRPRPEGCQSVAIKKLGPHTTEKDVRKLFRGLESLSEVRVICDESRKCTGLAFAEFGEVSDVEAAVRRDGMVLRGHTLFVCYETKAKKERPDIEERKAQQAKEAAVKAAKTKKKKAGSTGGAPQKDADDDDDGAPQKAKGKRKAKQTAAENERKKAQKLRKKRKKSAEQEPAPKAPEEAAAEAPRKKKKKKGGSEPDAA